MTVVINELDVAVEPPDDGETGPPSAAPVAIAPYLLDDIARHLDDRRARVRAD